LRGLLPHLSALETKAALLASTDDVSMHNQLPPYDTRNAYGLGYLRSDRLIDFARNQRGLWRSATLDPSSQELRVPFSFEKGKRYGIVVTWHRMDVTRPDWSDLRLSVQDGPQELVFSDDTRNLYEKLVFDATSSQTLDVVASVKNLVDPQLPIGLVICELDAPSRLGAIHTLGPSCRGSGKGQGIRRILPEGKADVFGDTWSPVPLGHFNHRFMQLFDMRSQTQAMRIEGLALRHDDIEVFRHLDYEVELEVRMGYAKHRPGKIDKVFANNYASAPITVMTRKRIRLPVLESANTDPRNFEIRLPFDKAFTYAPVQGQYLVVELVRLDSNLGNTGLFYMLDASSDPGLSVSAVYGERPQRDFRQRLAGSRRDLRLHHQRRAGRSLAESDAGQRADSGPEFPPRGRSRAAGQPRHLRLRSLQGSLGWVCLCRSTSVWLAPRAACCTAASI
jgi:hypothetical protein